MLYEQFYDEINAELAELAARQREEEEATNGDVFTTKFIFIGSGEDANHAYAKSVR